MKKPDLYSFFTEKPHVPDNVDWEELIRLASTEAVLPSLHDRVQGLNIPAEIADFLEAVAELNAERNAKILSELHQVTALLNSIDIYPLALKGAAYLLSNVSLPPPPTPTNPPPAVATSPDPARKAGTDFCVPNPQTTTFRSTPPGDTAVCPRFSPPIAESFRSPFSPVLPSSRPNPFSNRYLSDVDLLIPSPQLPSALKILESSGYTEDTTDALAKFRHHLPPLRRTGGIPFELHHSLTLHRAGRCLLTASELFAASSLLNWNGVQIRIPSPNHLVTHLILHSQIQHPYRERIWPPLRAIFDLVLLRQQAGDALDWPSIRRRFQSANQRAMLSLHLLQVESDLGMPPPFPIHLSFLDKLRWHRRRLLNRLPALRFIDPIYLMRATLPRRVRLLRSIFSVPGGWREAARMLFTPGFYRRLLAEITLT